jgi:hypothetical protein
MQSRVGSVAQLLFIDFIGSIVWFPVWWYTTGLLKVVNAAIRAMRYRAQAYAFAIWIRNFFVPMYGQYDWEGRLISVFMRTVVLIGRLIAFVIESLIYIAGVIIWCLIPPLAVILAFENGVMSLIPHSALR